MTYFKCRAVTLRSHPLPYAVKARSGVYLSVSLAVFVYVTLREQMRLTLRDTITSRQSTVLFADHPVDISYNAQP